MDIETRTPVFRDGAFIQITVSPASTYRWYVWLGDGYSLERTIRRYFATCIDQMLSALYEDDAQERRPGRKSPWSTASAARFNDQFNAALRALPGSRNSADLAGLRSMPDLRVVLDAEAGRFLSEQEVLQIWRRELASDWSRAKQFAGNCSEAQHRRRRPERSRAYTVHHCMDIREVFQRDVVYRFNGRLVRSDVRLTSVSVARVLHCGKRADEAHTPGRRARAGARRQLATFLSRRRARTEEVR